MRGPFLNLLINPTHPGPFEGAWACGGGGGGEGEGGGGRNKMINY